jgi:hypothetical protein
MKTKIIDLHFAHQIFPTDWKKHGRFGKHERNKKMLENDVDLVTVFGNEEEDLIEQANEKSVQILEIS